MKIIPVGNLEPLDIEDIHRSDNGMYAVLIIKILIKFAIAALIVLIAGPKINSSFHMVNAGPFCERKRLQSFMPENDISALTGGRAALCTYLLIFGSHTPHHGIKATGGAVIIDTAVFSTNYAGLHPDTGLPNFICVLLHAGGIHLDSPYQVLRNFLVKLFQPRSGRLP
jgi:hypothetical protein